LLLYPDRHFAREYLPSLALCGRIYSVLYLIDGMFPPVFIHVIGLWRFRNYNDIDLLPMNIIISRLLGIHCVLKKNLYLHKAL